jgi:membrane protease YdiL (CAAX protease family)
MFFVLVPVPTFMLSALLDGPIGKGYGEPALGAALGILVVSLFLVVVVDRRPAGSLGLRLDALALRDLCIGMVIPTVQLGLIFFIELSMGWVRVKGFGWNGDIVRMALVRWLGVAFFEELLSRGYIFQSLLTLGGKRIGPVLALGITSAAFGFLHHADWIATIALIVIGTEFGVAYLVTRRL